MAECCDLAELVAVIQKAVGALHMLCGIMLVSGGVCAGSLFTSASKGKTDERAQ